MPVEVEAIANFSPLTARPGQEQLIIEGPSVHSEEGMLFSYDGKADEFVDVHFERARLDHETVEMFDSFNLNPPSSFDQIDYTAREAERPAQGEEPCQTRVELRAASHMPAEIHLFQLAEPGLDRYRYLEMTTRGAELVSNIVTASPNYSDSAPGCQKLLRVGDWTRPLGTLGVTMIVADNSALRLYFKPLTAGKTSWGDAQAFYEPLDLGVRQLKPTDPPAFQAHAVSIRSLAGDLTSARSTSDGSLLTIKDLKIGSDQLQLSVAGKGWVKINGEDVTVNFMKRVEENRILVALLTAADAALLAWAARLVFKSPSTSPRPERPQGQSRKSRRKRKGRTKKEARD
jgi:hypothetical protein